MAVRSTNNYKVAIIKETTYGAQIKTPTVYFADKFEWDNSPITQELAKKENSVYKAQTRTKITGKMVTGTLSGELTDMHEILLKAHFDDTSSPYLYSASVLDAPDSYNIYKLYLDSTGACTSYDVLLGAIINPLTITGESNGIVQYSCTIDAADYLQEVANSAPNALTLTSGIPVTGTPFLFGDIVCATGFSATSLISFNLELSKTLVDNSLRFQNSMTKTNDRYIQAGGTFSWVEIWDGTNNVADQSHKFDGQCLLIDIELINATKTWGIQLEGVLTDATRPDADRGILLGNYTIDLVGNPGGLESPSLIIVSAT